MAQRLGACLLAVALAVSPAASRADDPPCAEPACWTDRARTQAAAGDNHGALATLKAAAAAHPDDATLPLLLADAYVRVGNPFWAIRTLQARHTAGDCAARAQLAWVYLREAALPEARALTEGPPCAPGPDAARLALVAALIAAADGRPEDAAAGAAAAREARLWSGDAAALPAIRRHVAPDVQPDLAWRLDVGGGYTSNALLGSPTDVATVGATGSALLQTKAWLHFSPWVGAPVRPVAEGQLDVSRLLAASVEGLSTLTLGGRVGLGIGEGLPRVLVGYRPELLLLDQGDAYDDGPLWFLEGHRGEVEVEVAPWLLVFGGAGHRTFRELARTRVEADVGLGGAIPLAPVGAPWAGLLWAATGRVYRADGAAYHLFGGSALLGAWARLPGDVLLRASGSFAADVYPDSAGYPAFFPAGGDEVRRDLLGRGTLSVWSPPLVGVRVGAEYTASGRDSTAEAYGFTDHRALLHVTWSGDLDLPAADAGPAPVELEWGVARGEAGLLDRVQDLLRQDEQVQRASSCVR